VWCSAVVVLYFAVLCRAPVMSLCGGKCCGITLTTATLRWHSRRLQPWQVSMRSAALSAAVVMCALPLSLHQGRALHQGVDQAACAG
jgi:hypothetical protein